MPIFRAVKKRDLYLVCIKPALDWIVALVFLLATLPLMVCIAVALGFHYKGNPFYIGERVGKNTRIFKLIKFRSMRFPNDEKSISEFSRFLRRTSLDELPQLWNVLNNEISIVGPRPLPTEYVSFYNEKEKSRHWVKPGITGWAQVNGRNTIDWSKRMELDVYYVQNVSFLFDLKILLRTIVILVEFSQADFHEGKMVKFSDYALKRGQRK